MGYVILTAAACDLEPIFMKETHLGFIPMEYTQENRTQTWSQDAKAQDLQAFYSGQRRGELVRTSQVSPYTYETAMCPWLDRGFSVLYLALSGGLSSTFTTACFVSEKLQDRYPGLNVIIVDTKAATGGMGIMVERALRNRAAGMSIHENTANLMDAVKHIHHWFLVQDLMYLQRGGRISIATAAAGSVFHICPILQIDLSGKLQMIGRARGTNKAVNLLLEHYEENRTEASGDPVYVVDADAPEISDRISEKLLTAHQSFFQQQAVSGRMLFHVAE